MSTTPSDRPRKAPVTPSGRAEATGRVRPGKSDRLVSFGPPDYAASGSESVWTIVSLILSGPLVWGAVGAGLDWWLDTSVFKVIGIVVGLVAAFYLIWFRFFRE